MHASPATDRRVKLFVFALIGVLLASVALLLRDARRSIEASAMQAVPVGAVDGQPPSSPVSQHRPLPGSAPAIDGLTALMLQDPDESVRLRAVSELESIAGATPAPALETALRDPSVRVRRIVVETLAGMPPEAALRVLPVALMDPDAEIRQSAVAAIADIGGRKSLDALALTLHDADPRVRLQTVDALGELDDERARSLLQLALADSRQRVRAAAAFYLDE